MKRILTCAAVLLMAGGASGEIVPEKALHQAVERFVRSELKKEEVEEGRIEVRTRWQHDIELNGEGEVRIDVQRLSARPLRGPTVLRVRISVGGKVERTMSVTADVRFRRPVLVARRNVRRGEILAPDMFELAERDVTSIRDDCFSGISQISGLRARRSLAAGDVLTRRKTGKIPVVNRGEPVSLVAESRNLWVSTRGVALQDGGRGDRIRVRNQDSGKVVYGKVVDSRTVEVAP